MVYKCKYLVRVFSAFPVRMLKKIVLILSVVVLSTIANELPTYIKTCKQNDPNLNDCVKSNANLAMETLQYGDETLNLPKLDGVKFFESITVKPLKQLPFSLVMKNGHVYGVENIRVKDARIDLVQKHMELLIASPQIIWQCEYMAQVDTLLGQVSQKTGAYNITYNNGEYLYQMDYDLKDNNGDEYIHITSHNLDFKTVEIIHKLEDIGSNPVINGFWEQTEPHFITADVRQPCSDLVTRYLNAFFKVYPYNRLFKP